MIVATLALLTLQQSAAGTPLPRPARDTAAGRPCVIEIDSLARVHQLASGADTNVYMAGGVLAHCRGTGTTFRSDSAAYYGGLKRWDMVGRAHVIDTTLTLDANQIIYYLRQGRLDAHNNVVAVNRENHSTLRGPNLTYYRPVQGVRDTTETYATQRPAIDYRGASASDTSEPYVIVADRFRSKGNDRMWWGGTVTVDRSDLAARGDSMSMDQTRGLGVLLGRPTVTGKGTQSYTLTGTRIEMGLSGREMNAIRALGNGRAAGTDWTLTADTIHMKLADRKLQQAFAWGPKDSVRARAVSSTTTLVGDSLALDTPNQLLKEARSYRHAHSTSKHDSTTADSLADWMSGDTLTAHWIQAPDSTGKQRSTLSHVVARGTGKAFSHTYPAKADSTRPKLIQRVDSLHADTVVDNRPSLNYTTADLITVRMDKGRVTLVTAVGHVNGFNLDPVAMKDTTKAAADSGKARPKATRPVKKP
ncbi:MAG TPA: hypothetical protein VH163_00515 [Gemmatimonadales bacterium]|nr:hypothetical protein [Gemmatimonadales bacterium]